MYLKKSPRTSFFQFSRLGSGTISESSKTITRIILPSHREEYRGDRPQSPIE
ncbi:MAG UNVERIFIED_CONTAM: hypothetical protein LVR29_12905 [Microcystis novacekii LVE1205-3]